MRIFSFGLITLLSGYVLSLQVRDQLLLYISTRYLIFTLVMAAICFALGIVGTGWSIWKGRTQLVLWATEAKMRVRKMRSNWRPDRKLFLVLVGIVIAVVTPLGVILLIIILFIPNQGSVIDRYLTKPWLTEALAVVVLALGLVLPPQTLSSQAAAQRSTSLNTLSTNEALPTMSIFATTTAKFDIGDWIRRLNADSDLDSYVGKEVRVIGFVFQPENYPADKFLISRFAIACCTVDARPVGLTVKLDDWQQRFKHDQWLDVRGKFEIAEVAGEEKVVIVPSEVTETQRPERPYIY